MKGKQVVLIVQLVGILPMTKVDAQNVQMDHIHPQPDQQHVQHVQPVKVSIHKELDV